MNSCIYTQKTSKYLYDLDDIFTNYASEMAACSNTTPQLAVTYLLKYRTGGIWGPATVTLRGQQNSQI